MKGKKKSSKAKLIFFFFFSRKSLLENFRANTATWILNKVAWFKCNEIALSSAFFQSFVVLQGALEKKALWHANPAVLQELHFISQ